MTPQDRIDTGFAPWSLMTPDPAKARATSGHAQVARAVHEDKRAPDMAADDGYMFGDDGLTFGDLLDIVNPLQHLPVVGAVYRSITGDELEPGAKMAGGALYGGPVGFASAMINNAIEEHTGDDVMGHMLAMVGLGGDDAGDGIPDGVQDGTAIAEAPVSGPASGQQASYMQGSGMTASGPLVAPGTFPAGAEAQLAASAMKAGNALELDPAQAAFLERLAATGSGGTAPDAEAEPLDALLTAAPAATAGAGKRSDFGGAARISTEMAKHLAMLAQSGAPNQALPQMPQPLQPASAQNRAANQTDMRAASARYSAALPVSIDGSAPAANPFAAIEARQNQPDPFETAMNRLGLNPPTVTTRGGENTESKLMEAAFGKGQSQTATLADAAGITAPPGEVPSAMLDALQRYQAMKQQG